MTAATLAPDLLLADHQSTDAHARRVGGQDPSLPPANGAATPNRRPPEGERQHPTKRSSTPTTLTSGADALLLICADVLDDLERVRTATANRVRALADVKHAGRDPKFDTLLDGIDDLERYAVRELQAAMRAHPLGPWVRRTVGVGEKQAARLLAAIGDPGARATVSQLWAFCGYHVLSGGGDPGQRRVDAQTSNAGIAPARRRGQKANWSTVAKTRAYLVAESCIKQRHSPYRAVYDDGRAKYADAVHPRPCPRCGPSGRPAPAGSPLSDGHKHARAMRLVAKAILRDLWREARRTATTNERPHA